MPIILWQFAQAGAAISPGYAIAKELAKMCVEQYEFNVLTGVGAGIAQGSCWAGVKWKRPRDHRFRIGRRHLVRVEQQGLHVVVEERDPAQHRIDRLVAAQIAAGQRLIPVATREQRIASRAGRPAIIADTQDNPHGGVFSWPSFLARWHLIRLIWRGND